MLGGLRVGFQAGVGQTAPPSVSMVGSRRSSQPGSHQLASPISVIVAGTRIIRTIVASMRIAVARPSPIILTAGSSPRTKPRNTEIMIRAAEVITRAVLAMPPITDASLSPLIRKCSRMRDSRNTS